MFSCNECKKTLYEKLSYISVHICLQFCFEAIFFMFLIFNLYYYFLLYTLCVRIAFTNDFSNMSFVETKDLSHEPPANYEFTLYLLIPHNKRCMFSNILPNSRVCNDLF